MEMWTRDLAPSTRSIPRTRSIRLHVCHVSRVAPAGDHPPRAEAESTMSPAGAGTVGGQRQESCSIELLARRDAQLQCCNNSPGPVLTGSPVSTVHRAPSRVAGVEWL